MDVHPVNDSSVIEHSNGIRCIWMKILVLFLPYQGPLGEYLTLDPFRTFVSSLKGEHRSLSRGGAAAD